MCCILFWSLMNTNEISSHSCIIFHELDWYYQISNLKISLVNRKFQKWLKFCSSLYLASFFFTLQKKQRIPHNTIWNWSCEQFIPESLVVLREYEFRLHPWDSHPNQLIFFFTLKFESHCFPYWNMETIQCTIGL